MKDDTFNRVIALGQYITQNAATVRDAAKHFGMGKSTVHKDVTDRLKDADPALYEKVRVVLDYNLSVRHLRGGEATRAKCAKNRAEHAE
ncbi:MAG: sporulation transcriptional regulator SpoIIID [Clostridiales bacterium]|nr:sporulation transcriptional regulator SpoIIID [Clostridiales bacterium]